MAEISEGVVALLGEGDLVDGVPDEAGLQQVAGVLPGFAAVLESLDVVEEPLHHVGACGRNPRRGRQRLV